MVSTEFALQDKNGGGGGKENKKNSEPIESASAQIKFISLSFKPETSIILIGF